jgi:hypothetical protein
MLKILLRNIFHIPEDSNFDCDNEIEELLLVLEPVLCGISEFKSTVETPPALGKSWGLSPACRWVM